MVFNARISSMALSGSDNCHVIRHAVFRRSGHGSALAVGVGLFSGNPSNKAGERGRAKNV